MVFKVDLNDGDKNQDGSSGAVSAKDRKLFDIHTGDFKEVDPDVIGDVEAQIPLSPDIDLSDFEEAETASPEEIIRAQEIINKANAIEQNDPFRDFRQSVDDSVFKAMINTQGDRREEYLRYSAMDLFNRTHKAAKLFLKDWCIIHHWRQKWANPFKEGYRLKSTVFIPKIYNLMIVSTDDQITTKILAEACLTARDACVEAAKKCGFDQSIHRTKIFSQMNQDTLRILLNDPRYLHEQYLMSIKREHEQQIDRARFISNEVRKQWLRDLADKYKQGNTSSIV